MRVDCARVEIERLRNREDFPFAPLEGVGPNLAGWGVIETCLLLPQSLCVMTGPAACLRHSAFMAHARGFADRFYMLCIPELDMTMGNHVEHVEAGMREIAAQREEKVLFLIVCCPDYILGTDFSGVVARLEQDTGKRIILSAMAPITIGLKDSPFTAAYTSFADFLKHETPCPDPDAVNILGTFMPLSPEGELYRVLRACGVERIRQIPLCDSLEEFSRMADAPVSLILHPLANGLAARMAKDFGATSVFVPTAYGLDAIREQYGRMGVALGRTLDTAAQEESALAAAAPLRERLVGKNIAVGCSINGNPYELAAGLVALGLRVDTIFARGTFSPHDWAWIERLRAVAPQIRVYNVSHPNLCGETAVFEHIDVAYGVDAGLFCARAVNVPLSRYQPQYHGYENLLWMLEQTVLALDHPVRNHDWIYAHNFLI